MLHEFSDCQNFMLLHLIGYMIIFLRSHRVVLSVSMNWLWYWEVSVSMMSYTYELTLILRSLSQYDVIYLWTDSDTEKSQSVWCHIPMNWLWYWEVSVSMMSYTYELTLILRSLSQYDVIYIMMLQIRTIPSVLKISTYNAWIPTQHNMLYRLSHNHVILSTDKEVK